MSVVPDCVITGVGGIGSTVMVMPLLVTLAGLAHAFDEVSVQVTTSPLASVEEVYVAKLLPTFIPFTCH
jgi:hypothetical protein